jgi:uncharacterized protein YndB with AHSA1/START domain
MNSGSPLNATVSRRFDTKPEQVFDAWLNPALVPRWFAPGMGDMVRVIIDARVGGSFSFVQRRNGVDIDHAGAYVMLERPRRLIFTWGVPQSSSDASRVIVDIAPLENGSQLTLTHELHPSWTDYVKPTEAAWSNMLDAMAQALR